jgi:L-ascorbate metabolism protein UlaG (beta-lactamase superfamily)
MTRLALTVATLMVPVFAASGQGLRDRHDLTAYRDHFLKSDDAEPKGGAVRVTFLGIASLLLDDGETQILIDACYSRPDMTQVLRGKLETDPKVVDAVLKKAKVERLKAVFVAHSHYDHALDVAYVAKKTGATLHGSESTLNIGRGGDMDDKQLSLFKPGKEVKVGRFAVTVFASKHSPPIRFINDDLGETIDKPLKQPARVKDYKEGGSFDFLIRRGDHAILVVPSTNAAEGELTGVTADVAFLGIGSLGNQNKKFRDFYYEQTVGAVKPKLVVGIHWDNFFQPLSDKLELMPKLADDVPGAVDDLITRTKADKIEFGLMQGFQSVTLFGKK